MPKQAQQADLQAVTAARNIAAGLAGRPAAVGFRTELSCIVDTLEGGVPVFRNERLTVVLPRMRLMHWVKRGFESH